MKRAKRITSIVLSMVMLLSLVYVPVYASDTIQAEFWVSPNGKDTNAGTQATPFKTIQKARDAVRAVNDNMTGDIVVNIAKGRYYLDETITFTNEDSGTNGFDVVYKYAAGDLPGAPQIIGGRYATKWINYGNGIYYTNVNTPVYALYEGDTAAIPARYPNLVESEEQPLAKAPYLYAKYDEIAQDPNDTPVIEEYTRILYDDGAFDESIANNLSGLMVCLWTSGGWDWYTDVVNVGSIDTAQNIITLDCSATSDSTRPHYQPGLMHNSSKKGARYFLMNHLSLLDRPGEFYMDKAANRLYYMPYEVSNLPNVIIPAVKNIIEVNGESAANPVKNIRFEGLNVKNNNFVENTIFPIDKYEYFPERSVDYANIYMTNTENITIKDCKIENAAANGLSMHDYAQNNTVSGTVFKNIGMDGLVIQGMNQGQGDYSKNNTITNCLFKNMGTTMGEGSGMRLMQTGSNIIEKCTVDGAVRHGMSLKGHKVIADGAEHTKIYSSGNVVKYCRFKNVGQDSGDMGAIHLFGLSDEPDANGKYISNTFEQIVIENVNNHESSTDNGPSGMYCDQSSYGQIFKNFEVKSATVEYLDFYAYDTAVSVNTVKSYDSQTFENVSWVDGFDSSLMEYSGIGSTVSEASFDNGVIAGTPDVEVSDDPYVKPGDTLVNTMIFDDAAFDNNTYVYDLSAVGTEGVDYKRGGDAATFEIANRPGVDDADLALHMYNNYTWKLNDDGSIYTDPTYGVKQPASEQPWFKQSLGEAHSDGVVAISFDIMTENFDESGNPIDALRSERKEIKLLDKDNHSIATITLANERGGFQFISNGYYRPTAVDSRKSNTWYRVDIIADLDNDTVRYYVDGVMQPRSYIEFDDHSYYNGNYTTPVARPVTLEAIKFCFNDNFRNNEVLGEYDMWIDNLKVVKLDGENTKAIVGTEERVVFSETFEDIGISKHQYTFGNTERDANGNLLLGAEVITDPDNEENKILMIKKDKSTAARSTAVNFIIDTDSNADYQSVKGIGADEVAIVSYKWKMSQPAADYSIVDVSNGSEIVFRNQITGSKMTIGNPDAAWNAATSTDISGIEADKWYDIKMVIDFKNDKIFTFIDGKRVAEEKSFALTRDKGIKKLTFTNYYGAELSVDSVEQYFDDVRLSVAGDVSVILNKPISSNSIWGEEITDFAAMTAVAPAYYYVLVKNASAENKNLTLFAAVYKDGKLADVYTGAVDTIGADDGTVGLNANSSGECILPFGMTEWRYPHAYPDDYPDEVKLMLWDGETFSPITEAKTVK